MLSFIGETEGDSVFSRYKASIFEGTFSQFTISIHLDDRLLNNLHKAALMSGDPYEKLILDFVTEQHAKRLAADSKARAQLEAIATKHQCNILTEVTLDGEIVLPHYEQNPLHGTEP